MAKESGMLYLIEYICRAWFKMIFYIYFPQFQIEVDRLSGQSGYLDAATQLLRTKLDGDLCSQLKCPKGTFQVAAKLYKIKYDAFVGDERATNEGTGVAPEIRVAIFVKR